MYNDWLYFLLEIQPSYIISKLANKIYRDRKQGVLLATYRIVVLLFFFNTLTIFWFVFMTSKYICTRGCALKMV